MNWKTALVLVFLAIAAYAGYRYWRSLQWNEEFCEKLRRCTPSAYFDADYGSVKECAGSEAGARAMEDYAGCDLSMDCDAWNDCGSGIGDWGRKRAGDKTTNIEQTSPLL